MTKREHELAREFAAVIRADLATSGARTPTEIKRAFVASVASLAPTIEHIVQIEGHAPKIEGRSLD